MTGCVNALLVVMPAWQNVCKWQVPGRQHALLHRLTAVANAKRYFTPFLPTHSAVCLLLCVVAACARHADLPLVCPVVVNNTGNVRVVDISVQGDTNNCTSGQLAPGEHLDCFMWRTLTEADFANSTFSLTATGLTGTAKGAVALPALPASTAEVARPGALVALLSVATQANTSTVSKAGQAVLYTIILVRKLLSLVFEFNSPTNTGHCCSRQACFTTCMLCTDWFHDQAFVGVCWTTFMLPADQHGHPQPGRTCSRPRYVGPA